MNSWKSKTPFAAVTALFLATMLASMMVVGQGATRLAKATPKPEDIAIHASDLERDLKVIVEHIKQDMSGKKPLLSTAFMGYATIIKQYHDHPLLEDKTQYSKKWVGQIITSINGMAVAKFAATIAQANHDREKLNQAIMDYQAQCKRFAELLSNPEKVEKDKRPARR